MKATRIILTAYTASFRVPMFVGHQLTLPVPPLSTLYGLLSAAAGRWIEPADVEWFAYRCDYASKATDLEAIWAVERRRPRDEARFVTRNVLKREFLVLPRLTLYLPPEWEAAFRHPRYALLLGRTQDVAAVESLAEANLKPVTSGTVSGVLLPWELIARNPLQSWLHSLPTAMTNEPRRRAFDRRIFGAVDAHRPVELRNAQDWLVHDEELGVVVPLWRKEWVLKSAAAENV